MTARLPAVTGAGVNLIGSPDDVAGNSMRLHARTKGDQIPHGFPTKPVQSRPCSSPSDRNRARKHDKKVPISAD